MIENIKEQIKTHPIQTLTTDTDLIKNFNKTEQKLSTEIDLSNLEKKHEEFNNDVDLQNSKLKLFLPYINKTKNQKL